MDQRVIRAMELLKEAGRLDLIAAPAAPRARPARRAASGVAAAVVACSPPRGRQQVSGAGRGRSGRLALAGRGRMAGDLSRQPRHLGARRLSGVGIGGAGGGEGTPSVSARRQEQGRRLPLSGASAGAVQELAQAGNSARAIRKGTGRVFKKKGFRSGQIAASAVDGNAGREGGRGQEGPLPGLSSGGGGQELLGSICGEGALVGQPDVGEGGEDEQGAVKELSHILEWSDESDQGGSDFKEQLVEDDGLHFQVRPPIRTYGVFARGESLSEGLVEVKGSGVERRATRVGDSHVSDADMRFLQGGQCGSEGGPGELLTGLEPWEEEEVTAGPSTASCTGYRRGGEVVRAKELVTQYATGTGFAPPRWQVRGLLAGVGCSHPCGRDFNAKLAAYSKELGSDE
ncbi:hypothetical protein NDU88_005907 [Pleurodeles waltl]|uniref:Uncharacterized protein n=1 Tax=Pleurodeles waltl TaxID=8319 RepID=A0AAV7MXS1_PLEWA|nr:hypothetical protein NDU88_005907 [Pleurodeles waltl]